MKRYLTGAALMALSSCGGGEELGVDETRVVDFGGNGGGEVVDNRPFRERLNACLDFKSSLDGLTVANPADKQICGQGDAFTQCVRDLVLNTKWVKAIDKSAEEQNVYADFWNNQGVQQFTKPNKKTEILVPEEEPGYKGLQCANLFYIDYTKDRPNLVLCIFAADEGKTFVTRDAAFFNYPENGGSINITDYSIFPYNGTTVLSSVEIDGPGSCLAYSGTLTNGEYIRTNSEDGCFFSGFSCPVSEKALSERAQSIIDFVDEHGFKP